jgi:hypothetical protein
MPWCAAPLGEQWAVTALHNADQPRRISVGTGGAARGRTDLRRHPRRHATGWVGAMPAAARTGLYVEAVVEGREVLLHRLGVDLPPLFGTVLVTR